MILTLVDRSDVFVSFRHLMFEHTIFKTPVQAHTQQRLRAVAGAATGSRARFLCLHSRSHTVRIRPVLGVTSRHCCDKVTRTNHGSCHFACCVATLPIITALAHRRVLPNLAVVSPSGTNSQPRAHYLTGRHTAAAAAAMFGTHALLLCCAPVCAISVGASHLAHATFPPLLVHMPVCLTRACGLPCRAAASPMGARSVAATASPAYVTKTGVVLEAAPDAEYVAASSHGAFEGLTFDGLVFNPESPERRMALVRCVCRQCARFLRKVVPMWCGLWLALMLDGGVDCRLEPTPLRPTNAVNSDASTTPAAFLVTRRSAWRLDWTLRWPAMPMVLPMAGLLLVVVVVVDPQPCQVPCHHPWWLRLSHRRG